MDFFENQERARHKTHVLILYYFLAIALIIASVYGVVMGVYIWGVSYDVERDPSIQLPRFWDPTVLAWTAGITGLIVLFGSLFKIAQLARGGEVVATLLGGRPVNPGTTDLDERRVLNVVEEMSIASGVPVPRVFILDREEGINAFAAGFTPQNAVVAVTRGAATQLTRDELQGVVGHEFSHILNGDMHLNIRLMGVLHGILLIALIGYGIMRIASAGRSGGKDGNARLIFILFGLAIMAVGYIGIFFGNLIKAAVSRQREFLADASSIQFTRNPAGLAGALSKIAGSDRGSRIESVRAQETSHFFFGAAVSHAFVQLLSTHPPVEERIRRIDPSFLAAGRQTQPASETAPELPAAAAGFTGSAARLSSHTDDVLPRVGAPGPEHLSHAAGLIAAVPASLAAAAREPFDARATIYGLLMSTDAATCAHQERFVADREGQPTLARVAALLPAIRGLGPELRIPVVDMTTAGLRELSPKQYTVFRDTVTALVNADQQIDLFEYMIQWRIFRHLEPVFCPVPPPVIRFYSLQPILPQCRDLLACLAAWGASDAGAARAAYERGYARLQSGAPDAMPSVDQGGLQTLDNALRILETASPALQRRILEACLDCIGTDGWVTVEEAEIVRVVADCLGLPLPPFLPGPSTVSRPR